MRAAVAVGPVLDGVLDLAHRAGRNALLVGPHGIGKSQAGRRCPSSCRMTAAIGRGRARRMSARE
ncbi:MAG: hypothetical protein IT379_27930 [Deltaproteobacteria bacterium]|nr:hypothetical protein [Deltaproteobacteria bacterium]